MKFFNNARLESGWFEEHISEPLARAGRLTIFSALKNSVIYSLPFIIITFSLLFFTGNSNTELKSRLLTAFFGAMGSLGCWVSFLLPFCYWKEKRNIRTALSAGLFGSALFLSSCPARLHTDSFLGLLSRGGIIVIFAYSVLFCLMGELSGRLFSRKHAPDTGKTENKSSTSSGTDSDYAGLLISFILLIIPILILKADNSDIYGNIDAFIRPLLMKGDSLPTALLIVIFTNLLWFTGVHGNAVIGGITLPFLLVMYNENVIACSAGQPLPHVLTPSLVIWSLIGGAGSTLPLCVYMLFSKSEKLKKTARIAIIPSVFNINEPLIYGLPVMMNPILFIPFIVTPLIITVINYGALYYNLVGRVIIFAPFAIPYPFQAYFCTLDPASILLLLIDMAIASVIYFPFFRALEKSLENKSSA